jgi:hypothetical protein
MHMKKVLVVLDVQIGGDRGGGDVFRLCGGHIVGFLSCWNHYRDHASESLQWS